VTNHNESNYFRIGSFVIIGITLIIITILFLGSGRLFEKSLYIETYFNESVQGLDVGSPVKYRGMDIGVVKDITFVDTVYKTHIKSNDQPFSRYIYVGMEVTSKFITRLSKADEATLFSKSVADGLRIKLALQNLTGNAYLELNFVDPKTNPTLPIDWTPKNLYIPSATSMLARFSDNVQYLLDELKQVDINQILKDIQQLTLTSSKAMTNFNQLLRNNNRQISTAVDNLQGASKNLNELSEKINTYPSQLLFSKPPPKLDPAKL
jgi:ABC-type transporter Mla subunit MlaD